MSYADDLLMETNRDHQLLAFKQDAAGEGQITTDVVVRTEFSCYAIIFRPRRPHVENDTWKNRIYSEYLEIPLDRRRHYHVHHVVTNWRFSFCVSNGES